MIVGTNIKIDQERKSGLKENSPISNNDRVITGAGSSGAGFAKLYRQNYDLVFRYCAHRLFDRYIAEDITSCVFLKAVENFHRFDGTERQFRNWLYKIATNEVNNHLRKKVRRGKLLKNAAENAGNRKSDDNSAERLAVLKEQVLQLKLRYQTIITLRFFENLKLTEIAEILGSSDGTVRSQLGRALAKLRAMLDSQEV